MSISLFCQDLGALPAERVRALDQRLKQRHGPKGGIDAVFALVWPPYPDSNPIPQRNCAAFAAWRAAAGVPVYGWLVVGSDQEQAASAIRSLAGLEADGWCLDIEKASEGQNLSTLINAVPTRDHIIASLGGYHNATLAHLDFRTLAKAMVKVDWQCYFDSGEGGFPADTVNESYKCTFVIPGWEYRSLLIEQGHPVETWGKIGNVVPAFKTPDKTANSWVYYDSYRHPGIENFMLKVSPRSWGFAVSKDRSLWKDGREVGTLYGRVKYANIRCTLDVTRTAQNRAPSDWVSIAASARVPGSAKRPISVYLAENATDAVLEAIAYGAT